MASRDKDNKLRSPSVRSKLNSITGVTSDEKALIVRIGNLLDFLSQQNLQESNPRTKGRKRSDVVPVPQNVQATIIAGGFTVEWSPISFSGLSFYELQLDTSAVFPNPASFEIIDTKFVLKEDVDETVYVRVRAVSKRGEASAFSNTSSITVSGSNISVDYAQSDFENRTTVEPKPTLTGAAFSSFTGDIAFVGVGGTVIGSPLTFEDRHRGFLNSDIRKNEINYDLIERNDSCNGFEQKTLGIPDGYIERSNFYVLEVPGTTAQSFYYQTFIYSNSFIDFFDVIDVTSDPSTLDVELLRYRIQGSFYLPNYAQSGVILSGTMGVAKI